MCVSSPLKERRIRGADCCRPLQTLRANRRRAAPQAVMVTVMQVAHRDLNLDRKKKRGMNYYYREPREKYETEKEGKDRRERAFSVKSLIRSLACSLQEI